MVLAFALLVGAVGLLAGLGGEPASASQAWPAAPSPARHYVAQPGDTLWTIAAEHRGDVDHGRYVNALIELNHGTAIQAGQAIRLP
jgi:Tfp pilus assembly protein FimV